MRDFRLLRPVVLGGVERQKFPQVNQKFANYRLWCARRGEDRGGGGGECIEKPITWLAFLKSSGGGGAGAHLCLNQTTMDRRLMLLHKCNLRKNAYHFIAVQGLQSQYYL